jgi:hypothetical protein
VAPFGEPFRDSGTVFEARSHHDRSSLRGENLLLRLRR